MTSSNGNIFRVIGPVCGKFTVPGEFLPTKASDAELWCFHWSEREQMVEETILSLVIWDAIAPILTSLKKIVTGLNSSWSPTTNNTYVARL